MFVRSPEYFTEQHKLALTESVKEINREIVRIDAIVGSLNDEIGSTPSPELRTQVEKYVAVREKMRSSIREVEVLISLI